MSSFVGHSLAAFTIYACDKPNQSLGHRVVWLAWLVTLALVPDLDHFIPFLHPSAHDQLRVTHSLTFALFLPILTFVMLWIWGLRGKGLKSRSLQVISAGLSNPILDLFVGVLGIPLFWPFSRYLFKLPFGILPSAGLLSLTNYYLYKNLFIELGVLIPLFLSIYLGVKKREALTDNIYKISGLLAISGGFMIWAFSLVR
ncbi:metal-dependent hydrolase [Roseofilum sp. Guam]|uniref:metal-dependent hydrolase n=1 Tax=Roseofilum sp. Guam TaxID=2821502 RepID=UPI001B0D4860|nr:metal-dependent hydrolase [Roseofilum sp. Guam]MBP0027993.1 metal-dependent hydrolase [Roseofilum sp. Guam]